MVPIINILYRPYESNEALSNTLKYKFRQFNQWYTRLFSCIYDHTWNPTKYIKSVIVFATFQVRIITKDTYVIHKKDMGDAPLPGDFDTLQQNSKSRIINHSDNSIHDHQ